MRIEIPIVLRERTWRSTRVLRRPLKRAWDLFWESTSQPRQAPCFPFKSWFCPYEFWSLWKVSHSLCISDFVYVQCSCCGGCSTPSPLPLLSPSPPPPSSWWVCIDENEAHVLWGLNSSLLGKCLTVICNSPYSIIHNSRTIYP